jgi:D-3-phosphoglycerate dehydrogenase
VIERPRILNAEPRDYSEKALAVLLSFAAVDALPLDRAGLLAAIKDYDGLIVRFAFRMDRQVFDAATRLRVLACAATGLDHVDLTAARERGVTVLSLRGERAFLDSVPASAEHTLALLLSLTRRIPLAVSRVNAGTWNRDALRGHDLCGKTLGLVGLGRVGTKMAGYCLALGMRVLACDPAYPAPPPGVEMVAGLEGLLPQSDVLSVHAPLVPETVGLIGARELGLLPAGAVLVNTARGELVDEEALIAALDSGRLAGAALDVIHGEPTGHAAPDTPLLRAARRRDNLLVTPHIGGATWESMEKTELFIAGRLRDFFAAQAREVPA